MPPGQDTATPAEIARMYPQYWIGEDEEGSKNKFEGELFQALLKRMNFTGKSSYHKITNLAAGKKMAQPLGCTGPPPIAIGVRTPTRMAGGVMLRGCNGAGGEGAPGFQFVFHVVCFHVLEHLFNYI